MAGIQRRRGPDVVGAWGLIQPFADAAKLILKETIFQVQRILYYSLLHLFYHLC